MLTLSLVPFRRLFGAQRRRADANVAGLDLIYRLKSWPQLEDGVRTAEVYRMLSLMTTQPLSRRWLLAHSKLEPQQLDELLAHLARKGELEVIDPSRFGAKLSA